ncbi:hypothetical protein [Acinetobacter variabilis]|uniref:hypothetical protein n=1 Tax=Acinetobacter variabilis TaxID=70346 RepID=UPI0021C12CC5|nr:hypothetical protein [Acinetobacter variabilis]UXI52661.1 hypothetical protein N5980_06900 [Acinetobacter variabilis]
MSDFEEFARSQGFSGDFQRGCNGQYKSDLLHFMEKAFMHQQAEIDRLSSVLDERTKKWLQAIECGTYFENVAKPLKEENDSLRAQLSLQRDRNKALEAELTSSRNYGDDLHCQLNNMEACYIGKKKEVEDQQKRIDAGLEKIRQFGKEGCLFPEWLTWAEKALRGAND